MANTKVVTLSERSHSKRQKNQSISHIYFKFYKMQPIFTDMKIHGVDVSRVLVREDKRRKQS
jgi:hypothetical protein